jgi:proteasome accessory factor B
VVRVLRILQDLSRESVTIEELARRHGANQRTIHRDLNALEEAGLPIRDEPCEDSARHRKSIDRDQLNNLKDLLNEAHYLALTVALKESRKRPNSVLSSLEELTDKVGKALGTKARDQLARIERCFFNWDKFTWQETPSDVLWPLILAVDAHTVCRVTYRAPSSGNQPRTFPVLPLKVFSYNGTLYAHVWQPKFQQVLLLNLQRVLSLEPTEEHLDPPASYNTEQLEQSAFGIFLGKETVTYSLRFDAQMAPYVRERRWHPTQALVELKGGGVELTFTCAKSYEVSAWVASWKEHVEVLSPPELRDELGNYAQFLASTYKKPTTPAAPARAPSAKKKGKPARAR